MKISQAVLNTSGMALRIVALKVKLTVILVNGYQVCNVQSNV